VKQGRTLFDAGVAVCLVVAAALAVAAGVAAPLDRLVGDALLRGAARRPPPAPAGAPDVVLVAVDPRSLRAVPDWPWSRALHARAVERLHAAGARSIAFDVDFSSPRDAAGDAAFARAIRRAGNVTLAAFRQVQELPGGAELEIANRPLPALARAAAHVGSVHVVSDADGVLRRAPRSTSIAGESRPALAEAALAVASGRTPRTAPGATFAIDYRRAFPEPRVLSLIDVIEGRFDPRDVAGRVALVGATAVEFQDLWPTPLGPARPGVWVQAVALRTLAAERAGRPVLVRAPAAAQVGAVAGLLALACALGSGSLARSAARRLGGGVALGGVCVGGCAALLVWRGILVSPVVALGALGVWYVIGMERVRRHFGRGIALRELQVAALARVGEATARPASGGSRDGGLGVALALLGDVVEASGVAFLRVAPGGEGDLDHGRIDWRARGSEPVGDAEAARAVLRERRVRVYEGNVPGRDPGERGLAVYTPLHVAEVPLGVLVVERDRSDPLDDTQLRTIATVATQLALSADNLRLLEDLRCTFDSSIEAIASAVEARDGYTQQHCRRLALFSTLLAGRLGLDPDEVEAIRLGALMHDVGKVGIRDEVLLKPDRFSPAERDEMRRHAEIGHRIITAIHGLRPTTLACVRSHHERWDGSGYPDGLRGEEIPLGARIVAVVDVWDALSTARPYKPAFSPERVREILRKDRGAHFDPALVDLFLELLDEEGEDLLVDAGPDAARTAVRDAGEPR